MSQFSLVAFTSVYMFYCYPDRQRPRISQMLVLPPYQRLGHGGTHVLLVYSWNQPVCPPLPAELLREVCSDLRINPSTYDITVEDPSDNFIRLRDYVDCCSALQLPVFQPPTIHGPFQGAILTAATDILKLHKVHVHTCMYRTGSSFPARENTACILI